MSNSPLVNYTQISPNRYSPRNHKIDTITIHCVVGQVSVEALGCIFAPTAQQASSNYGVGYDGRIGMYVEEKDASWCSSSYENDNRAITIEVASDTTHPYAVTDKAYNALIELVTDICKRNGIKKLLWKGDKSLIGQIDKQNMTVHRWFANKACPGDYLYNLHGDIANKVNAKLGVNEPAEKNKVTYYVQIGAYSIKANAENKLKLVKAKGFSDAFITKVGNIYKVQTGAFNIKTNADTQLDKVKKAGFKDAFVTTIGGGAVVTQTTSAKKSVEEVAKEVIAGKWGNGTARKTALEKAGYDYNAVQDAVNKMMK